MLLDGFPRAATDALARLFLAGEQAPALPSGHPTAADCWLKSLADKASRDLPPGLPDGAALFAAADAWTAAAGGVHGHTALRTGLRLHPPDHAASGDWEVELVLQTTDDPPHTVPAAAAWAAVCQELTIGARRYRAAVQRLLSDLPAMANLFPPLEPLQAAAAPARLPLAEDAVIELLEHGAEALQQAGFAVLLPSALVRAETLRASMHLRPAGGAGEPCFGLRQMVDVRWDLALGGLSLSCAELQQLARQQRSLVQFHGRWVQVDQRSLAAALRKLVPHQRQLSLGEALRLMPDAASVSAEGWVLDLLTRLQEPARMEPVPVPRGFRGVLRPYQQRGLDWLAFLRRYGLAPAWLTTWVWARRFRSSRCSCMSRNRA